MKPLMISRRRLIQATVVVSGAVPLGLLATRKLAAHLRSSRNRPGQTRTILNRPLKVPPDFLGMHFHRWPAGTPLSPPPNFDFGAVRSHDYSVPWYSIHLTPGKYNWSRLDYWVDYFSSRKKTLIYTLYGTPQWLATDLAHKDPYGLPGGASNPRDLSQLAEFIAALVRRYNGGGQRRIKFIESWNEPMFRDRYSDFWWGTPAELAKLARVVSESAKGEDPHIQILSPGFTGLFDLKSAPGVEQNHIARFLTADDGAGATGGKWCDGLAIHLYDTPVSNPLEGLEGALAETRRLLTTLSLELPIYATEVGWGDKDGDFAKASLTGKARIVRTTAAVQAALGIKGLYFYGYDDEFIGDPAIHPELSTALDDIHRNIAGNTLQHVRILANGAVEITSERGAFTW
jgi:hypothetical protein